MLIDHSSLLTKFIKEQTSYPYMLPLSHIQLKEIQQLYLGKVTLKYGTIYIRVTDLLVLPKPLSEVFFILQKASSDLITTLNVIKIEI